MQVTTYMGELIHQSSNYISHFNIRLDYIYISPSYALKMQHLCKIHYYMNLFKSQENNLIPNSFIFKHH